MRVQLAWLVELVPQLAGKPAEEVADLLTKAGIEVDEIGGLGPDDINGLRIAEVTAIDELTEFKKPIRYCQVRFDDGSDPEQTRGVVCGATNFSVGDRVVVAVPGALLPGGFQITARKTYGHISDGMICSEREMGLSDEHTGIMVLPEDAPIGADAVDYLGLHDTVLITEPTPDRGYQQSMRGIAREAAAMLGVDYEDPAYAVPEPPIGAGFEVVLDDPACDAFTTRIIRGFDPAAASPQWMRDRLTSAGMRPISLAVDVTNYVMLLLGQPMHAYDLDRLDNRIIVRKAGVDETITTLDDVKRPLIPGDDLLITDESGLHGIAGVMGAERGEINDATTNILLEAAHFDPKTTSRSVRRHGLLTEAGRRFERGVDPVLGPRATELATRLLIEHGGGAPDETVFTVGTPILPAVLEVDPQRIRDLVGVDYPLETIQGTLRAVGCQVEGDDTLVITPPTWRADLRETADIAEEVARIDGYDNIPTTLPAARAGRGLSPAQRARRAASRALAAAGFVETPSMSFQDDADLDRMGVPDDDERRRSVVIANPISAEQRTLRTTLLPGLLGALRRNISRGFDGVALYETGTVFSEPADRRRAPAPWIDVAIHPTHEQFTALDAALPVERQHAAVALTGPTADTTWWADAEQASWRDAIAAVLTLADAVGVPVEIAAAQSAPWHPGRCASVTGPDGAVLGYAGELHPAACEQLGVPKRTAAAEIDLEALIAQRVEEATAPQVSPFPRAMQDLALLVDATLPAAALTATIRQAGGELLEDARLFDLYTGGQVPDGKKSLAFALSMRADDRTLTNDEVTEVRERIIAAVQSQHDAVLR